MSEYLTSCIMSGIYHMFDFRSITTSMSFFIHTKNAVWIWVKSTEYLQLWSIAQAFLLVIFVPLFLLSIWRLRFSVVIQSLSHVWFFATPWTAARQASLSITNSQSLLKLMSIESVMPSNHLILCLPLLHMPSVFPSIRVFSNELAHSIRFSNLDKPLTCYPYFAQEWITALFHMDHLAISNLQFKISSSLGADSEVWNDLARVADLCFCLKLQEVSN